MHNTVVRLIGGLALAGCLASGLAFAATPAAQDPGQQSRRTPPAGDNTAPRHDEAAAAPVIANSVINGRQGLMLRRRWGIDHVHVRSTASGSVVRFSYRVVDAGKAKILNDKSANPYLIVNKTGARFEVPTTEKVGRLRQTSAPQDGREYWMVFTNVSRTLRPGDHVDIVIGSFRADELVVESAGPTPRTEKP
jgi:hypothetical protein